MSLVYARGMRSAHDLLTRWPAFNVATKRARLQDTFRFERPLRPACAASTDAAARTAARETTTWNNDSAVQRTIANRLGWLTSPALMADVLPRLETFAASIWQHDFADVVLLGMDSSCQPKVLRAVLSVAPG